MRIFLWRTEPKVLQYCPSLYESHAIFSCQQHTRINMRHVRE